MRKDLARPSGTGSHPADQAPEGLGAARFDPARVSDAQLAEACCPGESEAEKAAFLAALSDPHRDTLKRLIWAADELNQGRTPPGVIACRKVGRHA